MSKSNEYGCHYCGSKPKKLPYGSKRGKHWCSKCDCDLVTPVSKKRERQRAKKEIKAQELDKERE